MTLLGFTKYEGLGNDFLVVDAASEKLVAPSTAQELCDRHFGVGADGVLLVLPALTPEAHARMVVLNADGSRPEMCGNGLRCVALHLARKEPTNGLRLCIDTDAGPRIADVQRTGDSAQVHVTMGRALREAAYVQEFRGKNLEFTRISVGNPHAIAFDVGLDSGSLDELGPLLSQVFAGGTNVELATTRGPNAFDLSVWERGVGRTLACGTGAVATVAAAALAGRVPFGEPIEVRLPGGSLEVTVSRDSLELEMRGPARLVFSGQVCVRD